MEQNVHLLQNRIYRICAALLLLLMLFGVRTVQADGNMIILGDSRAEGMHAVVGDAGLSWCYKIGAGYNWMVSQGLASIDGQIGEGTSVVISLGVNDVADQFRISQYAAVINEKAAIWKTRGAKTFYASITPVDDALDHDEHNSDIIYWNNTIKTMLSPDVIYMDLYSPVIQGFSTTDGLHYTDASYQRIFDLMTQFVGAYLYQGSEGLHMTAADTEHSAQPAEPEEVENVPGEETESDGESLADLYEAGLTESGENAVNIETFSVRSVLDQADSSQYSGWLALNDGTYYMLDGEAVTGWIGIDHDFFYFDAKGRMVAGPQDLAEGSYLFGEDGALTHVRSGGVPVLAN